VKVKYYNTRIKKSCINSLINVYCVLVLCITSSYNKKLAKCSHLSFCFMAQMLIIFHHIIHQLCWMTYNTVIIQLCQVIIVRTLFIFEQHGTEIFIKPKSSTTWDYLNYQNNGFLCISLVFYIPTRKLDNNLTSEKVIASCEYGCKSKKSY
jgi:hypothetical protein